MFDTDKAATAANRMWLRMARALDNYAGERVQAGYPDTGIKAARLAEACYWQATGEGTAIDLKDVI